MYRVFLVAQLVKNLPAMWETWFQSLGWEDPLQEGMATHSSTLAWRILWTEEPGKTMAKSQTRLNDFNSLHFRLVMVRFMCQLCWAVGCLEI